MTEPLNDTIIHRLFKPITNSIHLDSIFITSAYSPSIDNKKKTHRTKSRFRPTTWHHEERNHHTNEIATQPKLLLRFDLSTELSPTSASTTCTLKWSRTKQHMIVRRLEQSETHSAQHQPPHKPEVPCFGRNK